MSQFSMLTTKPQGFSSKVSQSTCYFLIVTHLSSIAALFRISDGNLRNLTVSLKKLYIDLAFSENRIYNWVVIEFTTE